MYIHRPFHDISCERNRARRHVNLGMTRNCLTNLSTSESESGYVILKRVFFLLPPNRDTNTSITSTLLELSFSKKIFLDVEKRKKKWIMRTKRVSALVSNSHRQMVSESLVMDCFCFLFRFAFIQVVKQFEFYRLGYCHCVVQFSNVNAIVIFHISARCLQFH